MNDKFKKWEGSFLNHYAILCGSAPEGFRQKKLEDMYDFLINPEGKKYKPENIIAFSSGITELYLEGLLNELFDRASDYENSEVFLYLCAEKEPDLHAEVSGCSVSGIEVVKLGHEEVRKEVISYYQKLAEMMEIIFRVEYVFDNDFVSEESLGYEMCSIQESVS